MEQTDGDVVWGDLGFLVLLYIPGILNSASTNGITIDMDTPLPEGLRPSVQRQVSGNAISGGTLVSATFTIGTDGSIAVSTEGGFSDTGNNGLSFQGLSYLK